MLQVCVNGARRPEEHNTLPTTAAAIASDVAAAARLGVTSAHVHVKDPDGRDTLDAPALADVLARVRDASHVPVGVTTGAWAVRPEEDRAALVRSWVRVPDFASLNWHEDGAEAVAAALLDQHIGIEAGLWHAGAVGAWLRSPQRDRCFRALIELPDGLDAAATEREAAALLARVRAGTGDRIPVLLHGEGSSTWPAVVCAARWGLQTRIGLEDTLVMLDGSPAPDNHALVRAALELVRAGAAAPAGHRIR